MCLRCINVGAQVRGSCGLRMPPRKHLEAQDEAPEQRQRLLSVSVHHISGRQRYDAAVLRVDALQAEQLMDSKLLSQARRRDCICPL